MKETSVIVSNSYKKHLSTSYYMSIRLSLDGLSFCVFDPVNNSFVAMGDFDIEDEDESFSKHEELLLKTDIFKDQFKKTTVSIESRSFSVVPKGLYDASKAQDVLGFIGGKVTKDDKVLADEVEMAGAVVVYAVSNFLYYFLHTQFANLQIVHAMTPVMNAALLKRDEDKKKAVVHAVFGCDGVSVVVVEQNVLKLCNKFKYKAASDLVYIITYMLNQLGMNNEETKIMVSGRLERNDDRTQLLKRFAHNVSYAKLPRYFAYDINVKQPEHKYVDLFNMSLCV